MNQYRISSVIISNSKPECIWAWKALRGSFEGNIPGSKGRRQSTTTFYFKLIASWGAFSSVLTLCVKRPLTSWMSCSDQSSNQDQFLWWSSCQVRIFKDMPDYSSSNIVKPRKGALVGKGKSMGKPPSSRKLKGMEWVLVMVVYSCRIACIVSDGSRFLI